MTYAEEEYLQLSGLQHFVFCRRQWALIHIEHQWEENFRTIDGAIFHENAHDTGFQESRGDRLITRGVSVFSPTLGVSGQCDVLEYHRGSSGIPLAGREGLWQPYPVEYKRGKPKEGDEDILQLCGQAMCLEEMLCCEISVGYIYYGETRRRLKVEISEVLREKVKKMLGEMHQYYERSYTPTVKRTKSCNACSLKEICLPVLNKKRSVKSYIMEKVEEAVE